MDDLITWLRAQLDEDERVVRQLLAEPGGFYVEAENPDVNIMSIGAYTARWDPARVLAEIDAKRRVVEYAETVHERGKTGPAPGDGAWFLAVRILALPYADQPGYREEWRPTPAA